MRLFLIFGVLLLSLESSAMYAVQMPNIVARFPETKDLWNGLYFGSFLPGYHFWPIDSPVSEPWRNFLAAEGETILQRE